MEQSKSIGGRIADSKIAVVERKPKTSIKQKFLIFTVTLFLVILAGGGLPHMVTLTPNLHME